MPWRPKKTAVADDGYLFVTSRRNRFMSVPKRSEQFLATIGIRGLTQTIWNRLLVAYEAGVQTKAPF